MTSCYIVNINCLHLHYLFITQCGGGTLPGLHLLPAPPQQGWQQGADCLWSGLLLHVTCGPHCTASANALTHQIHQEHIIHI